MKSWFSQSIGSVDGSEAVSEESTKTVGSHTVKVTTTTTTIPNSQTSNISLPGLGINLAEIKQGNVDSLFENFDTIFGNAFGQTVSSAPVPTPKNCNSCGAGEQLGACEFCGASIQ
ncbi:MAG: hypothetical protein FWD84_05705 [Oscillospiraceae bacterium]|nr:hypothetical protein [Oscillospiraceae bacterium]